MKFRKIDELSIFNYPKTHRWMSHRLSVLRRRLSLKDIYRRNTAVHPSIHLLPWPPPPSISSVRLREARQDKLLSVKRQTQTRDKAASMVGTHRVGIGSSTTRVIKMDDFPSS